MKCHSCGSPKEKDEKYRIEDTTTAVTDPNMLKQARAGRNWSCGYCRFDNRALFDRCEQCGADRYEKATDPIPSTTIPLGPEFDEATSAKYSDTYKGPGSFVGQNYVTDVPTPSRLSGKAILIVLGVIGIVAVIAFFVWLFSPHEHDAQVASLRWQYTRTLEQRYTRHGEGWGTPAGAFDVSCHRRQRGTERCHPHDCNPHQVGHSCNPHDCACHTSCSESGNGYATCHESCSTCYDTCYTTEYDTCYDTCPVYDNWCSYNYYEWEVLDRERTSGTDHSVRWGTRLRADTSIPQRILTAEEYTVTFAQGEEHWTYSPSSLSDFNRYDVGAIWDVKTNYAGMIWPVHPEPSR
jgi:type II secretory pathway pseudopilin PulG